MEWLDILPESGTVGILGRHQYGKSALSYHIAEERHRQMGKEAVVLGPPLTLRNRFPQWVHIVTDLQELHLYPYHTAILDESSWPLHARQSMARDHVGFDMAMSVSVQLGQLFIFCTHHSRKLDPNVVTEYEVLAWKMPKKMHTVMERREIRVWAAEARAALMRMPLEERRAYTYVLYEDLEESAVLRNPLPSFWCEEIRTAAARALLDEMTAADTGITLLDAVRGLAQAAIEAGPNDQDLLHRLDWARELVNHAWKNDQPLDNLAHQALLQVLEPAVVKPGPAGKRISQIYQRLSLLTPATRAGIREVDLDLQGG